MIIKTVAPRRLIGQDDIGSVWKSYDGKLFKVMNIERTYYPYDVRLKQIDMESGKLLNSNVFVTRQGFAAIDSNGENQQHLPGNLVERISDERIIVAYTHVINPRAGETWCTTAGDEVHLFKLCNVDNDILYGYNNGTLERWAQDGKHDNESNNLISKVCHVLVDDEQPIQDDNNEDVVNAILAFARAQPRHETSPHNISVGDIWMTKGGYPYIIVDTSVKHNAEFIIKGISIVPLFRTDVLFWDKHGERSYSDGRNDLSYQIKWN